MLVENANVSSKETCVVGGAYCVLSAPGNIGAYAVTKNWIIIKQSSPDLVTGMDYLATNGAEANCYACRMMDQPDDAAATEPDFGSHFKTMDDMEAWVDIIRPI